MSGDGTLVYVPDDAESVQRTLVWVDRQGNERVVSEESGQYYGPRISPDGKRVALVIRKQSKRDVWIYDFEEDWFRRLTFEGDCCPIWSPDGKWITFTSNRDGPNNLYRKRADGNSPAERLTTSQFEHVPGSWSPDGGVLAFSVRHSAQSADIWILPLNADGEPQPLVTSDYSNLSPQFSPDGQWLAYHSREGDRVQVYISACAEPDVKWLVSAKEGGSSPRWSPDGSELFYRARGRRIMVVSVQTTPVLRLGRPRVWFESSRFYGFDTSPDGQRILMIKRTEPEARMIHVVRDWFEELTRN